MFYYAYQCFMIFSKSRNDRNCRIGDHTATDRLRDCDITEIGDNSAEIGNDAAEIVDIAAKVIPC